MHMLSTRLIERSCLTCRPSVSAPSNYKGPKKKKKKNRPVQVSDLVHIFQPLEHFTLSLEHGQHFLGDPLVPRNTTFSPLFSGLQDPRDPLAGPLSLVERTRGEDGLCGLAHGEDFDRRGREEDGLAEQRLGREICGFLAKSSMVSAGAAAKVGRKTHSRARIRWTMF